MKKSLQILFGLVLILLLAYVAFLDVSTKIKDDILIKTQAMFSKNNIRGITVNTKGEGLSMSRSLVLSGTAISQVEKNRIITLAQNIKGVCSIDNQIRLFPVVTKAPVIPKAPTVIKAPLVVPFTEAKIMPKEVAIKSTNIILVEDKALTVTVSPLKTISKVSTLPVVANKIAIPSISSTKMTTKIPTVPTVGSKDIVVPKPVIAMEAPAVIKIEKIKREGVE